MSSHDDKRRRFLKSLGLGAAAYYLNPIAGSIFDRAMGQATNNQQILFFVYGDGSPATLAPNVISRGQSTTNFPWFDIYQPLSVFRNQSTTIGGLAGSENTNTGHGLFFGTLAGYTPSSVSSTYTRAPFATTFDQHLAQSALGNGTTHSSIISGLRSQVHSAINATTPARAHFGAGTLGNLILPNLGGGSGPTTPVVDADYNRRKAILSQIGSEVQTLKQRLVSQDQVILDQYLQSFQNFDSQFVPRQPSNVVSCNAPAISASNNDRPEDQMSDIMDMMALAFKCKLTNVGVIQAGTVTAHDKTIPYSWKPAGYDPHSQSHWLPLITQTGQFHSQQIVRFIETISGQPGVMPSNLTVVLMPNTGVTFGSQPNKVSNHHGNSRTMLPITIFSGNSNLKTGGTYRFAPSGTQPGAVFSAISHALGVPMNSVGVYSGGPFADII